MALSPSGKYLFAANTPDNRLEIYKVRGDNLERLGSVSVGLEPIAVAARNDSEVWVVNTLSDSVSIVKLDAGGTLATVTRTLLVGDEPRDIVFAGANKSRAFITCAHRGQNTGDAYDQQTAGVGRADVWVFDANNLGTPAGGQRLTKLTFFADAPRALAATPDGSRVYAAAFNSGNQTTTVSEYAVTTMYPNGMPGPKVINLGGQNIPQPPTGLIVKYTNGHWIDAYGTVFDPFVKVKLPDLDVFTIDANASPPAAVSNGAFAHVGTVLFNMAVNPKNGKVYVTNTEAHNDTRFEGHNAGFTTVRGRIADSRITVIDPTSGGVSPVDLNPHVDFSQEGNPAEKALSVAFPQDITISPDGANAFVVAQGSSKLAIYPTKDLESGHVTPSLSNEVTLTGGGPTGVVLGDGGARAYALNRFDNSISVVDVYGRREVRNYKMFNPEPASVTNGRKYLYDANVTSQHGTTACASCHIGGDKDDLAWDLGNPGGIPLAITKLGNVNTIDPNAIIALLPQFAGVFVAYMPVKGPMTTQSLRGMDNAGAMHWRGDRNGAVQQSGAPFIDPATNAPVVSAQPDSGIYDEFKAFTSFNVAFPGLVGNDAELSTQDMSDFATFILQATYPPNPNHNLDNSLTAEQTVGQSFFFNHITLSNGTVQPLPSDRFFNCNGCHTLDPNGNAATSKHPGFFGTDGRLSFEFETQIFKVPHLRNLYTKVGMFASSPDTLNPGTVILQTGVPPSDQIRGFSFLHDGSVGQLEHFFTGQVFMKSDVPVTLLTGQVVPPNPYGIPFVDPNLLAQGQVQFIGPPDDVGGFKLRHALVNYLLAFDSNEAPIVGQQITMTSTNAATAGARLDLLEERSMAGECDLVAKTTSALGQDAGFLFGAGGFQPASASVPPISDADLRSLIAAKLLPPVTFTCVPVGSGSRIAIDRDGDGYADLDELALLKNPADPSSHP
ncbi:MAG TPA: hypothetical protein VL463_16370 [Kofleriaceae bacterium]|nr:hypothetical protein [Kofleriaceae bacterium]